MARLIGYVRLSPEHQERERESCAIQEQRIRGYCEAEGADLVEVVHDQDVSGKSMDRPGWRRVIAALESGEAAGLVVYRLDRLTRRLVHLLETVETFRERGWGFHAVADKVDTTSATGRLVLHILGSIAEWERDTMRERTSAALQHKIKQGLYIGGVPYGWRRAVGPDGKLTALEPIPSEHAVIGVVHRCVADQLTQDQIAQHLNKCGFPTRSGRPWSRRGVQCILTSPETDREYDQRRREAYQDSLDPQ